MTKKLINELGIGALTLALAGSLAGCDKPIEKRNYTEDFYGNIDPYEVTEYTDRRDTNKIIHYYDNHSDGKLDEIWEIPKADGKWDYGKDRRWVKDYENWQKAFEKIKQDYEKHKKIK